MTTIKNFKSDKKAIKITFNYTNKIGRNQFKEYTIKF